MAGDGYRDIDATNYKNLLLYHPRLFVFGMSCMENCVSTLPRCDRPIHS